MKAKSVTQELLHSHYLFDALSDGQRDELIELSNRIELSKEQILFVQGQEAHCFYILESGQARLTLNSTGGGEKVLSIIRPKQVFAEAIMFMEQQCYPATCVAVKKSVVVSIDIKKFSQYLLGSNPLCMSMLRVLSVRLREKLNEIESLTLQNATVRTVSYLSSMISEDDKGEATVLLDTPKHTLASFLSITPETLSRVLKKLQNDGLLQVSEETIAIYQPDALRKLAYTN